MIKITLSLFLFLNLLLLTVGCKNQDNEQSYDKPKDTLSITQSNVENLYIEDLLNMNSHENIVKKYGQNNVAKARFYYADDVEGTPATFIFKGTDKEVAIEWNDTINYTNSNLVTIGGYIKSDTAQPIYSSQWKSKTGLKIGMPLKEVIKLNGKDFTIGGLGWDYGGGVISWNGGHFTKDSNISIIFTDNPNFNGNLAEEEQKQVSGEGVTVNSSNKVIQKLNPIIFRLFINKLK